MSRFCTACGSERVEGATFCVNCGEKLLDDVQSEGPGITPSSAPPSDWPPPRPTSGPVISCPRCNQGVTFEKDARSYDHCGTHWSFMRCERCLTAWQAANGSNFRCKRCKRSQRCDDAHSITASDYFAARGGLAHSGSVASGLTLNTPYVRQNYKIESQGRQTVQQQRCLECGYNGPMAITYARGPWYGSLWFLIPLLLTGVGILFVIAIALLGFTRTKYTGICPACSCILYW